MEDEKILFYYEYEDNGWFSNYWPVTIILDGKVWHSTEHYYQAQKTLDRDYQERIRLAATSDDAKRLGNNDEIVLRPDWDTYKITAMRIALWAKFTQDPALKEKLLATGDRELVENSPRDYYWGIGADGSGRSMLGKLLMELRDNLR